MYDKIEDNKVIYEIEDFLEKELRSNDKHTNTIRIQLKKEEEIFCDKTENFI